MAIWFRIARYSSKRHTQRSGTISLQRRSYLFFFQAEDGIRYSSVTGVQTCALPILEMNDLRSLADQVRDKLKSGIVVLGTVKADKASLLVAVTKDLAARFPASELIKPAATEIGGSGGGRPGMAQGGGKGDGGLQAAVGWVGEGGRGEEGRLNNGCTFVGRTGRVDR